MEQPNDPNLDVVDITSNTSTSSSSQGNENDVVVLSSRLANDPVCVQEADSLYDHPIHYHRNVAGIPAPPKPEIQHDGSGINAADLPKYSPPPMLNQHSNILPPLEQLENHSAQVLQELGSGWGGSTANKHDPPLHPDQYKKLWNETYGPTQKELEEQHKQNKINSVRGMLEEIRRVKIARNSSFAPRGRRPLMGHGLSHPVQRTGVDQNDSSNPLLPSRGQFIPGLRPRENTISMTPWNDRDMASLVRSRPKNVTRVAGSEFITQHISNAAGVDGQLPSLMIQDDDLGRFEIDRPIRNSHAYAVSNEFREWLTKNAGEHLRRNPPPPRRPEIEQEMVDFIELFAPEVARQQRLGIVPTFHPPDEPTPDDGNWLGFRMEDIRLVEDHPLPLDLGEELEQYLADHPDLGIAQASEDVFATLMDNSVAFGGSDADYNARREANPHDFELVEEHQLKTLRKAYSSEQPHQLLQIQSAEGESSEAPATALDAQETADSHRDKRLRLLNVEEMQAAASNADQFSLNGATIPTGGEGQPNQHASAEVESTTARQPHASAQVPPSDEPSMHEDEMEIDNNDDDDPITLSRSSVVIRHVAGTNVGGATAQTPARLSLAITSTMIPADEPIENSMAAQMLVDEEDMDEQDEVSMIQTMPSPQQLERVDDAVDQTLTTTDQDTQDISMMDVQGPPDFTSQATALSSIYRSHPVTSQTPGDPLTPEKALRGVQARAELQSFCNNLPPGRFTNPSSQHGESSDYEQPTHLSGRSRDSAISDSELPRRQRRASIYMDDAQSFPTDDDDHSIHEKIQTRSRDQLSEPDLEENIKPGLHKDKESKPFLPSPILDKKERVYKCRGCKKMYKKLVYLLPHEAKCEDVITCEFCKGQFEFKTHLRDHKPHCPKNPIVQKRGVKEDAKTQGVPFRCRGCKEPFYNKAQLLDHERKCGKSRECSKCQEDFDTIRSRNQHWDTCDVGDARTMEPFRPIGRPSGYRKSDNKYENQPNVWDKIKSQAKSKGKRSSKASELEKTSPVEALISNQDSESSDDQERSSIEMPAPDMSPIVDRIKTQSRSQTRVSTGTFTPAQFSIVDRIKTQSRTQARVSAGTPNPDQTLIVHRSRSHRTSTETLNPGQSSTFEAQASAQKPKHLKYQLPMAAADKDGKYQCRGPGCSALFDNAKGLAQHESQYCQYWPKCKHCGHKFANKHLCKEHQAHCAGAKGRK